MTATASVDETSSTGHGLLTRSIHRIFAVGTVLTALLTNFVEGGLQAGLVQRQGDLTDADETVSWVTLFVGFSASLAASRLPRDRRG